MNCRRLKDSVAVRCSLSCVFVLATQFGLAAVARFVDASLLIKHVAVSGAVLAGLFGFGRCCKWLLGIKASAPASVILHLMFVWIVYLRTIRIAVSVVMDVVLNMKIGIIVFGMWRIMRSDPGWVAHDSISLRNLESEAYAATIEEIVDVGRIRHCKSCKMYVKGYDHHCPAFGNCIGQKNHVIFILPAAISYSSKFVCLIWRQKLLCGLLVSDITNTQIEEKIGIEMHLSGRIAISTMTFCLFQVTWQVLFLAWHIYCICNNIKTDEWINWTKYPEFHRGVLLLRGQGQSGITFHNPYNKSILDNLKEFFNRK